MQTPVEAARQGTSLSEAINYYTESGWTADLALLDALASVEKSADIEAVQSAVRAVYQPWLQDSVESFQKIVAASEPEDYRTAIPTEAQNGTCILFTDGLRFDIAKRLTHLLNERGVEAEIKANLTAMPSVTETAKPALSPAASALKGGSDFDTIVEASGSKVDAAVLRGVLSHTGFQVLSASEMGDPDGRAWSELGDIDKQGHTYGSRIARHMPDELKRLAERIVNLLDHGWQKVELVTDHGWILTPGELPKAELPEHLTEVRKGRCARLKEGASTEYQVVPWYWDPGVRVAVPPGIYCFEAGKEYEHGGLSPQECIIPTITATRNIQTPSVRIESVKWRRLRCNIEVKGATAGSRIDVRTRRDDPSTTIVQGGKDLGADGKISLVVEDEDLEGQAAAVVVVGPDGTVLFQDSTIVGDP